MSAQLTVSTIAESPYTDALSSVVTLPESLRRIEGESDLVGIRGAHGWPEAVAEAIRNGARGVLVPAPSVADTAELEALAGERGIPVVLDTAWANNPAVDSGA